MKSGKFYLGLIAILTGMITLSTAAMAEGSKPTCDMLLTAYSQYIWRGFELSKDSVVIFPETKVSYKGFSVDIWSALDTDYAGETIDNNMELNETRLTLSYGNSIGMFNYSAGWIYYDFDGGEDQEVFASLGLGILLSPTLTVYRGIENTDAWYAKLSLSYSMELKNKWSIDLGGSVAYYDIPDGALDGGDYSEFHDGTLTAALNIPITDWCTVIPSINYSFPLSSEADDFLKVASFDGNDSNFIYGGVTLSVSF